LLTLDPSQNGKLAEANEILLAIEKQARLANDIATLRTVAIRVVTLTRESNDWETLAQVVSLIAKRRQQKGTVLTAVVQQAMKYLDESPNEEIKLKLIETLRTVSEGKIHVEKERAELTQMLSKIKEAEGKVEEACDILNSVHVETFGSMSKMEKAEYILEQVRLQLAKGDMVRTYIVAKKINRKVLLEADFQDVKCRCDGRCADVACVVVCGVVVSARRVGLGA
jgi:26S proteasome regulatory subunit N5